MPRSGLFDRHAGDWADGIEVEQPGQLSPGLVRLSQRVVLPLVRLLFRPTLEGVGNLPRDRPFLLVANHSAGIGLAEIVSFFALYVRDAGADRPLAGFALPLGFHLPPLSLVLRAAGAIPSSFEAAASTLASGVPILVFPGGDHETLRPIWQAHRVDFGGRTGFLKIAREHGVPIAPMGIRGSHFTAPVLLAIEGVGMIARVAAPGRPEALGRHAARGDRRRGRSWRWCPSAGRCASLLVWVWLGSPLRVPALGAVDSCASASASPSRRASSPLAICRRRWGASRPLWQHS